MRNLNESSFKVRWYSALIFVLFFGLQGSVYGQGSGDSKDKGGSENKEADAGGWGDDGGSGGGGWGGFGSESGMMGRQKDTLPPYERFIPPYDSLRELIFYEGVVEDLDCEFCSEDSLYRRAERYLESLYGKKEYKKFTVEAKPGQVIWLKIEIPMLVEKGAYSKTPDGNLEFGMVIRFKDARYKYQFGNFAHITEPKGLASSRLKTYHEYYMKAKRGFRSTDRYLLTADKEVKKLVEGLKRALKESYKPDEDDW